MNTPDLERRLIDAFNAARSATGPNPDLFERVGRSLDADVARRRWRRSAAGAAAGFVAVLITIAVTLGDFDQGRFTMSWWLIELLIDIVLLAIAVVLGPFIKRFGRSYAADVFRANPRTGKSYLVLTDVAYYLIFSAFILFTLSFEDTWDSRADQLKMEVARLGGILLIMGVLHALNVVALPVIGQMLSSSGLEATPSATPISTGSNPTGSNPTGSNPTGSNPTGSNPTGSNPTGSISIGSPPLGPGTWIVRVEPATDRNPPVE